MINGLGVPGAMWAPLMAELDRFRTLVVELPGFGLTDTTPSLTDNFRRTAVRFLEQVLDGLELEAPPLIASSMGSLWTSWLALDRPDRVTALVHVGCPALALDSSAPIEMRLLSVPVLGSLMLRLQPPSEEQVEALTKMVNEYPVVPELADLLLATERLPGYKETFLSSLQTLLRLGWPRPEIQLTAERLGAIQHPTRLFWGRNDPFGGPAVGERMVEVMPDAELQVVDGGHAPWLTQSTEIAPLIEEFLAGRSIGR